jgi:hypothetical protein
MIRKPAVTRSAQAERIVKIGTGVRVPSTDPVCALQLHPPTRQLTPFTRSVSADDLGEQAVGLVLG